MFHVLRKGSEHSSEADRRVRKRGRRDLDDEIFRQTTAGVAPFLD